MKTKLILMFITLPLFVPVLKGASMGMGHPCDSGFPFPPCPIPLDNSIILLLMLGILYGGYKVCYKLKLK